MVIRQRMPEGSTLTIVSERRRAPVTFGTTIPGPMSNVYYPDYLQLDKILGAQAPESDKAGVEAHDEMLFIIIHQAYELWFKQVLYEVGSSVDIFKNK